MHTIENKLTATWKEGAKTRHVVTGIRTWHVNLNPRAMPSLGFAKGKNSGRNLLPRQRTLTGAVPLATPGRGVKS